MADIGVGGNMHIFYNIFHGLHDPFPLLCHVTHIPEASVNVLFERSERSNAKHRPRCSKHPDVNMLRSEDSEDCLRST